MRVKGDEKEEVEVVPSTKKKEKKREKKKDKREKASPPQHTSPWEVTLPSFSLSPLLLDYR
jgi:hypothetical protein